GYGYAKVSRSVSESWGDMMETYLEKRGNLACVIQLVDIRHAPSRQDVEMQAYLRHYGLNGPVVATKADKISVNQRAKQIKLIRQTLGLEPDTVVIPVSSLKKTGHEALLEEMERILKG
ncbi:MAG: GTP-binding protein, partial [Anaerovoracaceae bacterium]